MPNPEIYINSVNAAKAEAIKMLKEKGYDDLAKACEIDAIEANLISSSDKSIPYNVKRFMPLVVDLQKCQNNLAKSKDKREYLYEKSVKTGKDIVVFDFRDDEYFSKYIQNSLTKFNDQKNKLKEHIVNIEDIDKKALIYNEGVNIADKIAKGIVPDDIDFLDDLPDNSLPKTTITNTEAVKTQSFEEPTMTRDRSHSIKLTETSDPTGLFTQMELDRQRKEDKNKNLDPSVKQKNQDDTTDHNDKLNPKK